MFILEYVANHFVMVSELILLLVLLGVSVHVPKRTVHMTRAAAIMILLSSVFFTVEEWLGSQETFSYWRYVLSYANYILLPAILIIVMQISAPISKKMFWLLIPEVVNIILVVTSPWTKIVCWFDVEANAYHAGSTIMYRFPYFVFIFYMAVFFVQNYLKYKNLPLRDRLSVLAILIASMVGLALYMIFEVSSDYSAIFTSSILLYYLFLYIHLSKVDPLTGMLNRQCFYRDSATFVRKITAVVSVDMNELKWINDTKGHDAGDKAIKTVAECLVKGVGLKKTAYRVGGDEFIILYFGKKEEEVLADVQCMRDNLAKTPFVCAFGYAPHASGEKVDAAMTLADKAMYADKADLKRAALAGGGEVHERTDDWFL